MSRSFCHVACVSRQVRLHSAVLDGACLACMECALVQFGIGAQKVAPGAEIHGLLADIAVAEKPLQRGFRQAAVLGQLLDNI